MEEEHIIVKTKSTMPFLGKHHTPESKKKIGDAQRGKKHWNYGKHVPEDTRKKMSFAHSGEKHWNYGKHHTEETRRKISISREGKSAGKDCYWYGKKHKPESITKMKGKLKGRHLSPSTEFKSGKESLSWKGGKSREPYPFEFDRNLTKYLCSIYREKCQSCGKQGFLHIHHIDYDKKNINLDNLIPLCRSCHGKTNYRREYWKDFLGKKVIFLPETKTNKELFPGTEEYRLHVIKVLEHSKNIDNKIYFNPKEGEG